MRTLHRSSRSLVLPTALICAVSLVGAESVGPATIEAVASADPTSAWTLHDGAFVTVSDPLSMDALVTVDVRSATLGDLVEFYEGATGIRIVLADGVDPDLEIPDATIRERTLEDTLRGFTGLIRLLATPQPGTADWRIEPDDESLLA